MSTMFARIVALSVVVLAGVSTASASIIDLTSGSLATLSARGTDNSVGFQPVTVALPASGTLSLAQPGMSATVDYSFSAGGFTFSNARFSETAAGGVSTSASADATAYFTPNVPVDYTLAGAFSWSGNWGNGLTLWARLQDVTDMASPINIANHFYSKSGVLSSAALSVTPATGRPTTGTLTPGHIYQIDLELAADNNANSTQTGTAIGNVSLTLTPEPGTLALLVLGAVGMIRRSR
jgi:hypothetical protein